MTTDYGPTWALIGSPKIYAAIHMWGGKAGMAPGPAAILHGLTWGWMMPANRIFTIISKTAPKTR